MTEPTREELLALIEDLRAELRSQWESSHAEHCGKEPPLHDGECYWPPPDVLEGSQ